MSTQPTFQDSSADKPTINQAQLPANAQATSVVSMYVAYYGPITPAMMAAANMTTPIDYVIQYVVAQQWSGTAAAGKAPLSLTQLAQASNLAGLLPFMPVSGASLLPEISEYLDTL
jgi:hypothetical protein